MTIVINEFWLNGLSSFLGSGIACWIVIVAINTYTRMKWEKQRMEQQRIRENQMPQDSEEDCNCNKKKKEAREQTRPEKKIKMPEHNSNPKKANKIANA